MDNFDPKFTILCRKTKATIEYKHIFDMGNNILNVSVYALVKSVIYEGCPFNKLKLWTQKSIKNIQLSEY